MADAPLPKTNYHSRQSSRSSAIHTEMTYVQKLRTAKATVWAEKGPRDTINDSKKKRTSSQKKGRFGKLFASSSGTASNTNESQQSVQSARPLKSKLRIYAAPQHNTLVPRLSASEANESDDFINFTSSAYASEPRSSNAPSLARSGLHHSMSQNPSLHIPYNESNPPSPSRPPRRMDSIASSHTGSMIGGAEAAYEASSRRTLSQAQFMFPSSTVTTSRSGSPTQLQQQYTMHHLQHSGSSDDEIEADTPRPKLFIANADISDSD